MSYSALYDVFEYLCYGSTVINMSTLTMRASTLVVRIESPQTSDSDVESRSPRCKDESVTRT